MNFILKNKQLVATNNVLGVDYENNSEEIVIQVEDTELLDKQPFIEFKTPDDNTYSTGQLSFENTNYIRYLLPNGILQQGYVQLQLIFRGSNDYVWKSFVVALVVKESINATNDLPVEYPDIIASILASLNNKVDKEEGKGLSTNDYTNSDKEKVTYSYSQIETINGAIVVIQSDIDDIKRDIITLNTALGNKVDKTNESNKVYGTDSSGNQKTFSVDNTVGADGNIVRRASGTGQITVPITPTTNGHSASKKYVDDSVSDKVVKTTSANKVYGTDVSGVQVLIPIDDFFIGTIARRNENGSLTVPLDPVYNGDATSKQYVDLSTAKTLVVSIDPSTYIQTFTLKDGNNEVLSTQTIDLPLETMVVSGRYDNVSKSLILTLKNGTEITIPIADIISGLVSQDQLTQILTSYYTKTQVDNALEEKANVDGNYPTMSVGLADNLNTDLGNTQTYPQIKLSPIGSSIEDGNAKVDNFKGHSSKTINLWDEECELGYITNGNNVSGTGDIRSKNYIPCLPNTNYYIKAPANCVFAFYDKDKNWISPQTTKKDIVFTTPNNCYYMRFYAVGISTYNHDICINVSNVAINGNYYPYFEGIKSSKPTKLISRGFNQWDEELVTGYLDETGDIVYPEGTRRTTSFIKVIPNIDYYIPNNCLNGRYAWYDINHVLILYSSHGFTQNINTSPTNAYYLRITVPASYGTTYNNDICINISNANLNGTYRPYHEQEVPLDLPILRSAGTVQDECSQVKIGVVDLGTLNWIYWNTYNSFYTTGLNSLMKLYAEGYAPMVLCKYNAVKLSLVSSNDQVVSMYNSDVTRLLIKDTTYGTDATAFKTAMSGVILLYELATPTPREITLPSNVVVQNGGSLEIQYDNTNNVACDLVMLYRLDIKDFVENVGARADVNWNGSNLVSQQQLNSGLLPKANIDDLENGSLVPDLSHNIKSTVNFVDKVPYLFRTSGGSADIGDREYDEINGGSIVWNQLITNGNFADSSGWSTPYGSLSVSNNVATYTLVTSNHSARLQTSINFIANHNYLISESLFCTKQTGVSIQINTTYSGGVQTYNSPNSWNTYSCVIKPNFDATLLYLYLDFTSSLLVSETIQLKNIICIDLTQMFGSTIADYIYSLEQQESGTGVTWFKNLFPKSYYTYNVDTLLNVKLTSHDMVGFNAWDGEWEVGRYSNSTGDKVAGDSDRIRNVTPIPVLPNTTYYKTNNVSNVYFYDIDNNFISYSTSLITFTTPDNCYYICFFTVSGYGTTYKNDICINLSSYKNGEYEPYELHSYELDTDLELRGIPKLDANNKLYFDGDIYEADGNVTRKYVSVDLSTLNWSYDNSSECYFAQIIDLKLLSNNMLASKYTYYKYADIGSLGNLPSGGFTRSSNYIYVKDSVSPTGEFIYELTTPTTETANSFQTPQYVNDFGTEQYVVPTQLTDVEMPVGHITNYPANLRDKLQRLPNMPENDGVYVVNYTNRQCEFTALSSWLTSNGYTQNVIPAPPNTNGTYTLKVTIVDGVATYTWEA